MKQQADEKKQSVVSTPVIVIAVIAIGAMVYLLLQPTSSPAPQPNVPKVQTEPVTVINPSDNEAALPTTNVQSTTKSVQSETFSKDSVIGFLHSSRDPFKPSGIVLKVDAPPKPNQKIEPVVVQPVTSETPNKETADINAVLKGIVKTSDKQVAMINFNRKTHLLYVGDRLPDTNYLVADINNNSVLLISPNKRLRLEKKEAK